MWFEEKHDAAGEFCISRRRIALRTDILSDSLIISRQREMVMLGE